MNRVDNDRSQFSFMRKLVWFYLQRGFQLISH
uniref:Uncharacterized protein n=1 Tax=Rhizophora mucronata TaxID=61149 RepID=A0A2P2NFE2_RHIMU